MAEYLEYDWRSQMLSRDILEELPYKHSRDMDQNIAIQGLRALVFQCQDVELKNNMKQDDATLLKFLYARKFNVPDAYQLLQNYYWYRKKHGAMFDNFSVEAGDIRKALENVLPGVLTSRDRKGR